MVQCECESVHVPKFIVLTGGPGAGKTALLELIRQSFCRHVQVLPEAAGVVFGGGFPRYDALPSRRAAQRAIYFVQRELEATVETHHPAVVLCDRGTVDGVAYWPGDPTEFFSSVGSTMATELLRYNLVIHLETPSADQGYNNVNPLRTEDARTAAEKDKSILDAWSSHPNRSVVHSASNFMDKCQRALAIIREELPDCCRQHQIRA